VQGLCYAAFALLLSYIFIARGWFPAEPAAATRAHARIAGGLALGLLVLGALGAFARRRRRPLLLAGVALLFAVAVWNAGAGPLVGYAASLLALGLLWLLADGPRRLRALLLHHDSLSAGLVSGLACLILLEALLQLAAWLVAPAHPGPSPGARGADLRILCAGDSYVAGVGASDRSRSWPMRLQAHLRSAFPELRIEVLTNGMPGANSSMIRNAVLKQLSRNPPDLVIVCCGINNEWNLEAVDLSTVDLDAPLREWRLTLAQWALRLRLVRLVRLAAVRLGARAVPNESGTSSVTRASPTPSFVRTPPEDLPAEPSEAIPLLLRELDDDPENALLWRRLGTTYATLFQYDEALSALDRAIALDPGDYLAWRWKGFALSFASRPDEALTALQFALEHGLSPNEYRALLGPIFDYDKVRIAIHLDRLREERPDLFAAEGAVPEGYFRNRLYWRVLKDDLAAMARAAADAGAIFLVHTYPHWTETNPHLKSFGLKNDCLLVSHWELFQERLKSVPYEELFQPDNHCTDAGYEVMAENMVGPLRAIISRRLGLDEMTGRGASRDALYPPR
jgi:tetratricopeptide (TPR) repeat protein